MSRSLSDQMEFDHVVRVHSDGTVTDESGVYAPDVFLDEVDDSYRTDGWTLLSGFTNQHGYRGAVLHPSEFIGGGLERHILANPGVYVSVVVYDLDAEASGDDGAAGWAVAFRE